MVRRMFGAQQPFAYIFLHALYPPIIALQFSITTTNNNNANTNQQRGTRSQSGDSCGSCGSCGSD
ncbi:hypothetical protein CQR48_1008 [Bifidobacterium thermophilum]|nr:hypothetical protein CQR48_1008 [Bifidobacterium thermophilum]